VNWSNVRLIVSREIRDQLRDRRTLFMIVVVPLLLYPLLGMSFFQLSQFMREHPNDVLVLGAAELDSLEDFPKLIEDGQFASAWLDRPDSGYLLQLTLADHDTIAHPSDEKASDGAGATGEKRTASQLVHDGDYHLIVEFPPGFGERMRQFREQLARQSANATTGADEWQVPEPPVHYNSTNEKSRMAYGRMGRLLHRWKAAVIEKNLERSKLPSVAAQPFRFDVTDVAEAGHRDAVMWARILPFVLLIWALTGAFYPAIDLCAGEKERGTLETLLSSPAERSEIVWGKLITVMLFSVVTAILNLVNMCITGAFIIGQLNQVQDGAGAMNLSSPLLSAAFWLLLALGPVSALFSALCLALAAFARSSKEGQYYLLPLILVTMPLMVLPMAPGVELNLGNALIPVTGVMLLLRTVLEGNVGLALPYVPIVVAVTLGCCLLAVRWAIDQFNKESVLFRESERLDMGLWVKHLVTDRQPTPGVAAALCCVALIMMIKFFMQSALPMPREGSFSDIAVLMFITQVVIIVMPALLMTILLTGDPRKTLLLDRWPRLLSIPAALMLAVALHPLVTVLSTWVQWLYPMSKEVAEMAGGVMSALNNAPYVWLPFLLLAVLPAICEEVAFRGFILSGLRHLGHKWWAIGLTAVFFGITHGFLQQSLMATLTGCVIGYLAVQTGSLIPCILFHMTHNGLMFLYSHVQKIPTATYEQYPALRLFLRPMVEEGQTLYVYDWTVVVLGGICAACLLAWLGRLPFQPTVEEKLQDVLQHQAAGSLAS